MSTLGTHVVSNIDPWAVEGEIGLRDARMALGALLTPTADSVPAVQSGVLLSGDSHGVGGTTHTALRILAAQDMAVTVAPGSCVIDTDHGPYVCTLDTTATLRLAPASRSMNRIDLVIARVSDDLHPDLCSPCHTRQFAVEIWTGDPSPTIPLPPEPTGTGWIPLAQIRVNADTTQLTDEVISDVRGPGLPARGGIPVHHDPTAAAVHAAGPYPGARRWIHGCALPDQYWPGGRDGWKAVPSGTCHTAAPGAGDWLWLRGGGARREVCSVSISDPGVPYSIYPTGRVSVRQSPRTAVDAQIRLHDAETGPLVNWTGTETGDGADTRHVYNVAPVRFGPFTGDLTVHLVIAVVRTETPEHGVAYRGDDIADNLLSVEVWPS